MTKIKFTTSSTEEVFMKMNVYRDLANSFQEIFFENINLNEVLVIFKAYPSDDLLHKVKEFKRMRRKTKTLELYLVLDYNRIMQGTDEENLQHIKEVFAKGCETFLKPMKGFDWNAFVKIAFPEQQKLVA